MDSQPKSPIHHVVKDLLQGPTQMSLYPHASHTVPVGVGPSLETLVAISCKSLRKCVGKSLSGYPALHHTCDLLSRDPSCILHPGIPTLPGLVLILVST